MVEYGPKTEKEDYADKKARIRDEFARAAFKDANVSFMHPSCDEHGNPMYNFYNEDTGYIFQISRPVDVIEEILKG